MQKSRWDKIAYEGSGPMTAKAAFMLASIMMMDDKDGGDETTEIVRALHGAISCPDWLQASHAWQTCSGTDACLHQIEGTMTRAQSNCAIANLTEIALAAGTLSTESESLLMRIAGVLDPAPGFLDQAIAVIASKNQREIFTAPGSGSGSGLTLHIGGGGEPGLFH